MLEILITIILIALCTASISYTITSTKIFKPLRELISKIHPIIESFIHCPYCVSHWVSLILIVQLYDYNVFNGIIFYDNPPFTMLAIYWFAVMGVVPLIHYIILKAYDPVAKYMLERRLTKLKKNQ